MNNTLRKVLICVAAVVALCAIVSIPVNQIAKNKLNAQLAGIAGATVHVDKVNVALLAGNVTLKDVDYALQDSTGKGIKVEGKVEAVKLKGLRWSKFFKKELALRKLQVEKASASLVDSGSPMKASVKALSLSVSDIGVMLDSGNVEYCDSLYSVSLDSLDYTDKTGLSRILVGHLETADAGAIQATGLRFYNCVPMEQLAEKMGKVASMWYDAKLDTLHVDPVNIPRMVKSQKIELDRVSLSAPDVVIFQDDRYKPAVPYPTIQESLNASTMPINIKQIDAGIKNFTFIWETAPGKKGSLPMYNIHADIKSVSNAHGNVMKLDAHGARKGHCSATFALSVKNDKAETTNGKIQVKNLDVSAMDSFVGPLFGMTAKADIHQIDAAFKGDKTKMSSDFCVRFDNLEVKAKESSVLTFLANTVLPKSNPVVAGTDPKEVAYSYERDVMQPYPAYLVQCVTLGMLHTILPGSKVNKVGKK